jgi:phage tail protein I
MSKDISAVNLTDGLPYALASDDDKHALASCIAEELEELFREKETIMLYARIDKLDESILDILASDFKVDWYLYDGTLETKRAQIKSCFKLHHCLGTKKAMMTAISDVFPGSAIEEWFEYGGNPYHFTLVLDITESGNGVPITQKVLERIVNAIKPVRAVLESDSITYRVRNAILVSVKGSYALYDVRRCGTYPEMAEQGSISENQIDVSATIGNASVRGKTNSPVGTYPNLAIKGEAADSYVSFATCGGSATYSTRVCGLPFGAL